MMLADRLSPDFNEQDRHSGHPVHCARPDCFTCPATFEGSVVNEVRGNHPPATTESARNRETAAEMYRLPQRRDQSPRACNRADNRRSSSG